MAPGPPCPVEADGQRLQQAVGNLVDDALRHARTRVAVSAVAEEADAVLTVDDDGPGIDPAHRDDVFTRLYPSAANGPSGAGVGLALSRELVVAMGGQLVAGEAPDGGARLTLRLPSAAPADQAVVLSSKTMMLPP